MSVGGSPIKSYTYDKSGRVQSVTTSTGTTNLAWDGRSRLTGITYPSSATNSFAYNAFGARMSITDSAGTRALRRSGASVLAPVVKEGADRMLPGVWEKQGASTFNPWSGLKNVERQLGATAPARHYDAFGNILAQDAGWTGSPSGYGGAFGYQEDGDSGLKLLGHRYYDPDLGRFLSRDPIQDGRNWYVYCENNPLTWVDPTGLVPPIILNQGEIEKALGIDEHSERIGQEAADRAEQLEGKGPKDCKLWLNAVYEGLMPMPPNGPGGWTPAANYDNWFDGHPDWVPVPPGSPLRPGDVGVREPSRRGGHGHVIIVTDDDEYYDASIASGSRPARNGRRQSGRTLPSGPDWSYWRPRPLPPMKTRW